MNGTNLDELKELYKSWSNEELNNALTKFRDNYLPEAIELIQLELSKRNSIVSDEGNSKKENESFQSAKTAESNPKTTPIYNRPKIKLNALFNKLSASVKLFFGVIVFSLIAYVVSENPFEFSEEICLYIVYFTISFIFTVIMTSEIYSAIFTYWGNSVLFKYLLPFFLSNISTALLVQHQHFKYYEINFWVCLFCWIYLYVVTKNWDTVDLDDKKNADQNISRSFEKIIIVLSAAWTISSVFIILGTTIFDYGKLPINNLQEIHSLLDLRINLAIIIVVFVVIKSIVFVLQNKKVTLQPLFKPREQLIKSGIVMNPFLQVLTSFLNLAINLLGSLGNIFYKAFATIIIYLFFIGGEIFNSFSWLLNKSVNLLFYLLEFMTVIAAFYFINKTSLPLLQYLRENTWFNSYFPLSLVITFSIATIICIISINYFRQINYDVKKKKIEIDIKSFNEILAIDIQAFPYLIAVIWVTGVVIFFIAKIDFLHFTTFKTFGIMSTILSSVVLVGFIIYLYNNFKPKKQSDVL